MIKIQDILNEKNVVKKAYLFGIYVGLYGHVEWSGWVRDILESIYREAESLGIYDEVKEAYNEGKEVGRRERIRRIHAGLMKDKEKEEISREKIIVSYSGNELRRIAFPRNEDMPRFLRGFKMLKFPKFLRGG
ncbi:hypothetical protein [Pyrococcus horikoshii]|uniref:Uncharacterized protein n=2 Tax=Pyrococcus horikoshii TaxID=53953 RepID=O58773_PYRHO|nr:hypothetical protein [Pyrococcus horikoshii]BAA30121.1 132aa long hypothetical protein [Pyrococcus horikoshii OT3]HII61918.1 hypothetical protein [Pyrococcus horikoshii]